MNQRKEDKHLERLVEIQQSLSERSDEFIGVDLDAEVIDVRLEQQIARMINKDLKNIKKGSFKFFKKEEADLSRVKECVSRMLEK